MNIHFLFNTINAFNKMVNLTFVSAISFSKIHNLTKFVFPRNSGGCTRSGSHPLCNI